MNRQLDFRDERPNPDQRLEQVLANRYPISLLLDGVINQGNIGMLFRLADAARLDTVYLYNMKIDINKRKINKAARSTISTITYQHLNNLEELNNLKKSHQLVALEKTTSSELYTNFSPQKPVIIVAGSEKHGISKEVLESVDTSIYIPMHGLNTSMNVACAASIAIYSLLDKILQ